jgi:hypothetical protein
VEYLGHIVSKDGVAVDPSKIQAMADWPIPKTIKALQGFLGLTGYYRKFVRDYGKISSPLTALLKKEAFQWTETAEEAFNKLKHAMTITPVLVLPDFTKTFIIESDASGVGIGVVLMQEGRPLAFTSKALSPLHLKMSVYDNEMLVVVHAVTKWRHYLIGRRFQIRTDHRSLKYLLEQLISSMEQQKWVTKLLGYDYETVYKKGVENLVADALSRIPEQAELHSISTPTSSTLELIKEEQQNDPELQQIVQRLTHDPSIPHYSLAVDHLRYKGRIILASHSTHKVTVLQELHAALSAGHSGFL